MVCQNCKSENNFSAKFCKKCGDALGNTNIPLSGGERIKLIVYFIILLATSFPIGSGAITLVVSLVTLYVIKTNKNFDSIGVSVMIIVITCLLVAFGWFYSANIVSEGYYKNSFEIYLFSGFAISSLILIVLSRILFFPILEKHEEWIITNGLFADEPTQVKKQSIIIGRDNLSTFSIADEMLKWNELLEKGLITQEEFNEAKQKLLYQGTLS